MKINNTKFMAVVMSGLIGVDYAARPRKALREYTNKNSPIQNQRLVSVLIQVC